MPGSARELGMGLRRTRWAAVALVVGASLAASGFLGPASANPGTPPTARAASVFRGLELMDGNLAKLISDYKGGEIGASSKPTTNIRALALRHLEFVARVGAITRQKRAIFRAYFDGPTYGNVRRSEVFSQLECIDSDLWVAKELNSRRFFLHENTERQVLAALEGAQKCEQRLEDDLHGAEGSANPPPHMEELVVIDRELAQLIDYSQRASNPDVFRDSVFAIGREKDDLVKGYFDGSAYGSVTFFDVFTDLDAVDRYLALALADDPFGFSERKSVENDLRNAQADKQFLEKRLHRATGVGKPQSAPPCQAGSFVSRALQVTTPPNGKTFDYYFQTPIPNAAYYDHRHGYTHGGCDHAAGRVKINMKVYGANGSLISWYYESPPYPSTPPPDSHPAQLHYDDYCPQTRTQNGVQYTTMDCRVYWPQPGFALPSQGYSGPPITWDSTRYRDYAVIVRLQNDFADAGGTSASIFIEVSWKPA